MGISGPANTTCWKTKLLSKLNIYKVTEIVLFFFIRVYLSRLLNLNKYENDLINYLIILIKENEA